MKAAELLRRVVFLIRRDRNSGDLADEIRLHRELRAGQMESAGMSAAEAGFAAARQFGNSTLIQEDATGMWSWNWLESLQKDLAFSARLLVGNPLFSAVAVLTLALGIGANTAIFSVANAVMLRALPARDAHRLFYVRLDADQPRGASNTGNGDSSFGEGVFEQLRSQRQVFEGLIAYVPLGFNKIAIRVDKTPEEGRVVMASGNVFSDLGINPICGRALMGSDETAHAAVAVISYGFWKSRFGGQCSAVGQSIGVLGVPLTVVGVAPKAFTSIEGPPTDVWIPLQRRPEMNAWGSAGENYYANPTWWCLQLIARLQPGITPQQARLAIDPAFQRAAYAPLGGKPKPGEIPPHLAFVPARGMGETAQGFEKPLYVLLVMVGLILVIACGNVAMLLTARNSARQREFSIRLAIGGSRMRLFRQLLAESFVLVCCSSLLGWIFALIATRALALWSELQISLTPDRNVLLFTMAIAVAAVLVFGLAPLVSTLRINVNLALKNTAATSFRETSRSRASRVVLILQVALCLVLTVSAALLVRTLRNLENINLGLRAEGLLVFGVAPPLSAKTDAQAIQFFTAALERVRSMPGVVAVSLAGNRPGSDWSNNTSAIVDGRNPTASGATSNEMRWNNVGPAFFETLGIPIRLGRDFRDSDSAAAPKAAIVNQTFADRYFKGREALGHQVSFTGKFSFTVVGVAANSKYTGVRETEMPMAWFPYSQLGDIGAMHLEVRTAGDPLRYVPEMRKTLAALAPDAALLQPMTQKAQFDDSIAQERLVARLSLCFGALAFLLMATGLYGTLAYSVSRRTSEIGVRMAVGARRRQLLWMILRESLVVAVLGIAIGVPAVVAASRAIASLLFEVTPHDPWSLAAAVVGIVVVCLAASVIPARRAASVDPLVALRYE